MITHREQGVRVEFERFADYWDADSPGNVSKIVLTPIKADPTRVAALLSGDVDFIAPVPPADLDRIDNDANIDLVTMSGTRIITFQLNQTARGVQRSAGAQPRSCTPSTTKASSRRS